MTLDMRKKHIFLVFIPLIFFATLFAFYASGEFGFIKSTKNTDEMTPAKQAPEPINNDKKATPDEKNKTSDVISIKDEVKNLAKDILSDVLPDSEVNAKTSSSTEYPLHKQITSTFFWAGEDASSDNKHISNSPSAWDDQWTKHFGGVDDPDRRKDFLPAGFTPKENPFYVALPYNDFNEQGKLKQEIFQIANWTSAKKKNSSEYSYCKNRWVKIIKDNKQAYAQWEDVGPFGENDRSYVFGDAKPKSKTNNNAGIDVSPAVRDYLSLGDIDKVDWQFVDDQNVPNGPWKQIITTSNIFWN
jgi:hypothetical protein